MGLAEIIARAARTQNRLHGVDVVLSHFRNGDEIEISARAKRQENFARQDEADGSHTTLRSVDWHFIAAELVDDDEARFVPVAGDRIVYVDTDADGNARRLTYEAVPFKGDPAVVFLDVARRVVCVHTMQVSDVADVDAQLGTETGVPLMTESGELILLES